MKFKIVMMALAIMLTSCDDKPERKEPRKYPNDIHMIDVFETEQGYVERMYDKTYNNICYVRYNSVSCVHVTMQSEIK